MAVLESPEVLYLAAAVFGGKVQIGFETACVRLRLLCFQTSYFVNLAFLHILYHKMLFFSMFSLRRKIPPPVVGRGICFGLHYRIRQSRTGRRGNRFWDFLINGCGAYAKENNYTVGYLSNTPFISKRISLNFVVFITSVNSILSQRLSYILKKKRISFEITFLGMQNNLNSQLS